jgi:ATP-dependent DNA helicase RecG
MAHGRKFRSSRRSPGSERSMFEQKLNGRYSRTLDRTDLLNLIRGGEDTYVEFKIRLVNTEKVTAEIVALANSGGGAIVFGVNDQRRLEGVDDPEQVEEMLIDICRNKIKPPLLPHIDKVAYDSGVRVVVLQVDDRRGPHSASDNRYYIRIGSTKREAEGDEIAQLFTRLRCAHFEDLPLVTSSVDDVDEALVWSYIRDVEGEVFRQPDGFPTGQALRDLRLAADHGARVTPTLAGFLLFGKNSSVQAAIPQSQLELIRYSGGDSASAVVERAEFFGNLGSLFDSGLGFIKRYVDLWESRPTRATLSQPQAVADPVRGRPNFPKDAVAEALTNLLVHRNYSTVGQPSRALIFDDRLELINPFRNDESSKKSIEYGVAAKPNPRLHRIFTSAEYGLEPIRRGLPALRRAGYAFSKREPKISILADEFRLELHGI